MTLHRRRSPSHALPLLHRALQMPNGRLAREQRHPALDQQAVTFRSSPPVGIFCCYADSTAQRYSKTTDSSTTTTGHWCW